jgi:gluconokinase
MLVPMSQSLQPSESASMSPSRSPLASQPDVIVIMGVAGCGKTVVGKLLAEQLSYEFLDADAFHSPENVAIMRQGIPLDDEKRGPWLDTLAGLIDAAIVDRRGIVLACSALKRRYRTRLGVGKPHVRLVHLDGPETLLRERIEQRTGHFMPASQLASQCALLERPTVEEAAIIIDIAPPPDTIVRGIRMAIGHA